MISEKYILRQCLSILVCIGFSCCATISASASEEIKETKPSAIDKVARTVVYLEFDKNKSEKANIGGKEVECDLYYKLPSDGKAQEDIYLPKIITEAGTGFLVKSNILAYVVTAKHLVKNSKGRGRYWVSPVEGDIISGKFEDIRAKLKEAKWFFHKHADVAVHPIVFPRGHGVIKVSPVDSLSSEPVELLTSVCVPGFPHTLGKDNISLGPLVATTEVASWPAILPGEDPRTKVIFLSERLAKGYSGAPVFTMGHPPSRGVFAKHTMKIVGIQSGVYLFPDIYSLGKRAQITQNEVSYIVPVTYLLDLLKSEEVQSFEKNLMADKISEHGVSLGSDKATAFSVR